MQENNLHRLSLTRRPSRGRLISSPAIPPISATLSLPARMHVSTKTDLIYLGAHQTCRLHGGASRAVRPHPPTRRDPPECPRTRTLRPCLSSSLFQRQRTMITPQLPERHGGSTGGSSMHCLATSVHILLSIPKILRKWISLFVCSSHSDIDPSSPQ